MTKTCPNCKTKNVDDATFCQNCGKNLNQTSQAAQRVGTTQEGGAISDWWNKRSKGAKTGIGIAGICCIGLILILAFYGMSSPDKTTTTPTTPSTSSNSSSASTPTVTGVQVQVIYDGEWTGAIDQDGSLQSVDGSGSKTFNMTGNPSVVSVNFQKKDGGSGTLTVNILKDGKVVKTTSTSAQYGVAGTVASF